MIGETTYIACQHKQQLLPSTKQELPAWIYVGGKVQFKSMCCLEGIECSLISFFPPMFVLFNIILCLDMSFLWHLLSLCRIFFF